MYWRIFLGSHSNNFRRDCFEKSLKRVRVVITRPGFFCLFLVYLEGSCHGSGGGLDFGCIMETRKESLFFKTYSYGNAGQASVSEQYESGILGGFWRFGGALGNRPGDSPVAVDAHHGVHRFRAGHYHLCLRGLHYTDEIRREAICFSSVISFSRVWTRSRSRIMLFREVCGWRPGFSLSDFYN